MVLQKENTIIIILDVYFLKYTLLLLSSVFVKILKLSLSPARQLYRAVHSLDGRQCRECHKIYCFNSSDIRKRLSSRSHRALVINQTQDTILDIFYIGAVASFPWQTSRTSQCWGCCLSSLVNFTQILVLGLLLLFLGQLHANPCVGAIASLHWSTSRTSLCWGCCCNSIYTELCSSARYFISNFNFNNQVLLYHQGLIFYRYSNV